MPSKKNTAKPATKKPARKVTRLYLHRFWEKDEKRKYVPRRSSIFDDRDLLWVKSYEALHDYYLKKSGDAPPLLKPAEMALYLDRLLLEKRGETFSVEEYAADRGIGINTVSRWLDNLENVKLIHRERSSDGSDHAIIIVTHSPLPPDELRRQRPDLAARRAKGPAKGYVQKRKREAGRNKRDWLPTAFSRKKLLRAFYDDEWRAERFENIVGDIVHQHLGDRTYSRRAFAVEVMEVCKSFKLNLKDEHVALAFEIKEYIERIV